MCIYIYIYLFIPQTKGGTTGVGFLLILYRITFVNQDFPSSATCLDLPTLASTCLAQLPIVWMSGFFVVSLLA